MNIVQLKSSFQAHPFHLVTPSPWPLLCSSSLLILTIGSAGYFNGYLHAGQLVIFGLILTIAVMGL
jgi:cytochrome c oxidase subunit 3